MDPIRPVDPPWQRTVLVCCNQRPLPSQAPGGGRRDALEGAEKPSCGRERGAELRGWLKARSRSEGLKGKVIVMETSCLGVCSPLGVTIVASDLDGTRRSWVVPDGADREDLWRQVKAVVAPEPA